MKTKVAAIILGVLAVVSLCLAQTPGGSPRSGEAPSDMVLAMRMDLTKTQAQLQQAVARISALERQVRALEQANAKLEKDMKAFGQPRLVPLEQK